MEINTLEEYEALLDLFKRWPVSIENNEKEGIVDMIVPITNHDKFLFDIKPSKLDDDMSIVKFPTVSLKDGEDEISLCIKHLENTTGYIPGEIIYMGSHIQEINNKKEKVNVYLAHGCMKVNNEIDEKKIMEVPYKLGTDLMNKGYLMDANSYIALSKSDRFMQRKNNIEYTPSYQKIKK